MINKKFDLEERTLEFSKNIIELVNMLPKNQVNTVLGGQIVRSATSIGANYREANDALGKKDFLLKIRTCRKEAKETVYWLQLILKNNGNMELNLVTLLDEVIQLVKILSSIVQKSV